MSIVKIKCCTWLLTTQLSQFLWFFQGVVGDLKSNDLSVNLDLWGKGSTLWVS